MLNRPVQELGTFQAELRPTRSSPFWLSSYMSKNARAQEASPKIIGWKTRSNGVGCPYKGTEGGVDNIVPCADCNADIKMAVNQLISTGVSHEDGKPTTAKTSSGDHVDWTKDEQDKIEAELQAFLKSSEPVFLYDHEAWAGDKENWSTL